VCVTWSIFELENTSGANYVFILGRGSVVEAADRVLAQDMLQIYLYALIGHSTEEPAIPNTP
jgi:hypothetical protein